MILLWDRRKGEGKSVFAVRTHYYVTFTAFFVVVFYYGWKINKTLCDSPNIVPWLCVSGRRPGTGCFGDRLRGTAGLRGRCPRLTSVICLPLRGAQPLSPLPSSSSCERHPPLRATPPPLPTRACFSGENTPSVPADSGHVSSLLSSEIIISPEAEVP